MAQQINPENPTVLVRQVAIVTVDNTFNLEDWQRYQPDEITACVAVMRSTLVASVSQDHPGALFAFTEPRIGLSDKVTIRPDKSIGKLVKIEVHAFVFEPADPVAVGPSPN